MYNIFIINNIIYIYIYSCQVIWKTLNAEFFLPVYLGGESGVVG